MRAVGRVPGLDISAFLHYHIGNTWRVEGDSGPKMLKMHGIFALNIRADSSSCIHLSMALLAESIYGKSGL